MVRALGILALALLLAGCTGPASPGQEPLTPTAAPAPAPTFALHGTQCEEAGFVAAYNSGGQSGAPETLADVWQLADIRDEIGSPMHDAVGRPANGPMTGNWHMGFHCQAVDATGGSAKDYVFGYVGDMVKAPPWDPGGADLHFLMSGFGFANGTIADALRNTTAADITPAAEARVDWYVPKELPRSAAYVVYRDAEKGVYESWSDLALLRQAPERTIRLWWQVPVNGTMDHHMHHNAHNNLLLQPDSMDMEGQWYPVYWDLHVGAAPQYTTPPVDGVELASHNMLKFEHGPVAAQPTLTDVYELPALDLGTGHVVTSVVLTKLWNH